jgi:hypothetical protein
MFRVKILPQVKFASWATPIFECKNNGPQEHKYKQHSPSVVWGTKESNPLITIIEKLESKNNHKHQWRDYIILFSLSFQKILDDFVLLHNVVLFSCSK